MEKFADSLKDLKQLLEVDKKNSAARAEFEEVKKLWEKQLRVLQADAQQQKKAAEGDSKLKGARKEHGGEKEKKGREATHSREELERLLAATKSRIKEMEKTTKLDSTKSKTEAPTAAAKSPPNPRSRTSGQRQPNLGNSSSSSSNSAAKKSKRRKVMVEEVNGKASPSLHRLSSQPSPRENRPMNKRQEKVPEKKKKGSPLEEEHARVLTQEIVSQAEKEARMETERVEKALAEKEKELESKRALLEKEKRMEEEKVREALAMKEEENEKEKVQGCMMDGKKEQPAKEEKIVEPEDIEDKILQELENESERVDTTQTENEAKITADEEERLNESMSSMHLVSSGVMKGRRGESLSVCLDICCIAGRV